MMERYIWRILLIDDDEDDYVITRQLLSEAREGKFLLEWASSFVEGKNALDTGDYNAVLVDYDLGPRTGIELIQEAVSNGYRAPILLLTGRGKYEVDVAAMEAGAADYLSKGELTPAFLERAIRYAIERKKAASEREQLLTDLARAQAVAHTGSWRLDVRQNALLWSDETYRIFDIPIGTPMTYEKFLAQIHPDDRGLVNRTWTAALQGEPYDIEHRIIVRNNIKWVREKAELEFDRQGVLQGGFGTVQDITKQKQADQALSEALERTTWLARFPDENPDPAARVSAGGIVLYRNPAAAELPGWECKVGQLLPDTLCALVDQAISQKQGLVQDVQLLDHYFSISVMPFPEERYVNLYGRDITKRIQMEKALREAEERFRLALANPSIAVFSTDPDLRYNWFYSTSMGALPNKFIGKRDDEIAPYKYVSELLELKRSVLEKKIPVREEITLLHGSRQMNLIVTIEPGYDAQGNINGVVGTFFDMTEQRRLEAESFEHITQMEVHHRLLEYREKERQGIARDLHDGPVQDLSSLIFNIQILKEAIQDATLKLELEQIGATVKQTVCDLRGMINELRPPSLIRFGVEKAIQQYSMDLQEKHPECEIELNLQPLENENQLSEQVNLTLFRIFQETMTNIFRHAQATKAWVRLRQFSDYLILEVRDNGKGFPVSAAINKHTQNNHFGLAGMRERADAVGGEFNLFSEPGKGTTVHVTIPLGKGN